MSEPPVWLLCDYGEVLCLAQSADEAAGLEAAAGVGPALWDRYWSHRDAYDRGDLGVEEYWTAVLGSPPAATHLRSLIDLDVRSWLHPNLESLAATGRATERGLRLAIFSNAPLEIAAAVDSQEWLASFSPRIFSCNLRAIKPEPAAYAAVVGVLGARPDQVMFFDDKPVNVAAARESGLRAEVFTNPAQFDAVPGPD